MRKFHLALCILVLLAPGATLAQDDELVWEDEQDEYEAYFGRTDGSYEPGPSSLAEAKKTGRGYRIGSGGMHDNDLPQVQGEVHIVSEGDTLWGITERYFEDPHKWPQVWAWNPEVTNPHWIYPLDNIRLSKETLELDRALAGKGTATGDEDLPMAGPRVYRIGKDQGSAKLGTARNVAPGTIFLRDQGYLGRDELDKAGQVQGSPEEKMFLSTLDEAYVTVAEGEEPKAGDRYTLFRRMPLDERSQEAEGELVRIYGTVDVRTYDPETRVARALVTEALRPIERGLLVTKMPRRFDVVAPRKNGTNVIAKIIATMEPHSMAAYGDVVFLDVGQDTKVEPGNRFFVVRKGDAWVDTLERSPKSMGNASDFDPIAEEDLPKEVVAELRIIKVRKDSTIALVTRSDTDLAVGDVAEMRVGF